MKFLFLTLLLSSVSFTAICQSEPIYLEGLAQGTSYHITYFDQKQRNFHKDIDRLLKRFDRSVSTYQSNSLISKINHNQFYFWTDRYFNACFKKAKEIWTLTNGDFDQTVYPLANGWGFGPEKKSALEQSKLDSLLTFVGFDKIQLRRGRILKTDPRVSLDFNAFAQGYSVDLVSELLRSKGITSFIVDIGGEVYAQGKRFDKYPWYIGL